jgi:hypothetical protein
MSMPFVDPQNKPDLLRQINDVAARYAIRAATIGGAALVLLDVLNGHPGAFLLSGCTLLGSAVIATAIKGRPA